MNSSAFGICTSVCFLFPQRPAHAFPSSVAERGYSGWISVSQSPWLWAALHPDMIDGETEASRNMQSNLPVAHAIQVHEPFSVKSSITVFYKSQVPEGLGETGLPSEVTGEALFKSRP